MLATRKRHKGPGQEGLITASPFLLPSLIGLLVFSLLTVPAMLRSLQEVVRPPQENVRSETIAQALAEVTEPDAVIFTDNEFYISLFSAYQPVLEFRNPARSRPISFTIWDGLEDGLGGGTMSVREAVEALRAD